MEEKNIDEIQYVVLNAGQKFGAKYLFCYESVFCRTIAAVQEQRATEVHYWTARHNNIFQNIFIIIAKYD